MPLSQGLFTHWGGSVLHAEAPNWAEQLTAFATAVGALGLLGGIGAAIFAARQVLEARKSREVLLAAEFFRRWDEDALVESRQLFDRLSSQGELSEAFQQYVANRAPEAYVLYRELDFFEQLGALEYRGAFDFELIRLLVGRTLVDRWRLWQPALHAAHGAGIYPMFAHLAAKMRMASEPSE
jgi:hypothetical protein